jgi:hypothetical protein
MQPKTKELFTLLQEVNRLSKKEALTVINGLTGEGQAALANDLRRKKLEIQGQKRLPLPMPPVAAPKAPVKANKVPYTVLLPQAMIDGLKGLSEADWASVSHHIRTAIKAYLDRRR